MTRLTLEELQKSVRLTPGEVGQLIKAGWPGLWPLSDMTMLMDERVVAAVWLMEALSSLGVLDAPLRVAAMPVVAEEIATGVYPNFVESAEVGRGPLFKLADRRYVASGTSDYVDLQTGQLLKKLPQRPLERLIYDIGEIWLQRRRPA